MNLTPGGPPEVRDDLSGAISGMLGAEIENGEMPSASWLVMRRGSVASKGALGRAVVEPELIDASPDTIYDLASLTKPLVTTTLVLLAAGEGRIALDDPVSRHLTELSSRPHFAGTTWRDLLAHRAGFEAWYPLYVGGCDRSAYLRTILSLPPAYAPGTSVAYSDLGFVLSFIALERAWGENFDTLARNKIFRPLGAERCGFLPSVELQTQIAATERGNEKEKELARTRGLSFSGWRDDVIWGEVNDGNAFHLGGVSGQAGLFADAGSVARLTSVYLPGSDALPEALRRDALDCQAEGGGERRGLGWQLRTETTPAASLSAAAFGHTGFTGTSVWVDPEPGLVVVLLTNRIHPRVKDSRIQGIRRRLNEIVAEAYL